MRKILERVAETGESFQDSKKKVKGSSDVGQGQSHQGIHEENMATASSVTPAQTPAAATILNAQQPSPIIAAPQHTQTNTSPLGGPADGGAVGDSLSGEGGPKPASSGHCSCAAGTNLSQNITKFLVLAVQVILQTVQDKELAEKLSSSIKKSAEELLGFSSVETLATNPTCL